ncbi:MAG: serine hydrolase [Prevotellaceae bacterium]|jgi:beta-glucosidase-like glycosyl hydrolase/CubicO group peptidase (beta-lactamase class C family)|nr:serine hydrolase [Prevotellaceae bacterium]
MTVYKNTILLVCILLLFSVQKLGSTPEGGYARHTKYIATPKSPAEKRWVDSVMLTLSPRNRLAQLFMMPAYSNLDERHENSVKKGITDYNIGGLIFFQGTPEKQVELTNLYQSVSKIPLLVSMDAEWGVGMRLKSAIAFPQQMALGSIRDNSLIYELGAEIARQCKLLGVHINFAPVVDVNNNPGNPVINYRSFGENPFEVSEKGIALMDGMQDNGVIACAKHFPGHGDTDTDSHKLLPILNHSKERLDSVEFKPFKRLIDNGIAMVMIGHLYAKSLENTGAEIPASISKSVIQKTLRDEMSFQGLVISDALNMNGVKNYAGNKNVALEALKAGHDILLMPYDIENNILAIEKAIKEGEIVQEVIDERCRKILTVKYRAGLTKFTPLKTKGIRDSINSPGAQALKNRLVENSVILVENRNNILPLRDIDKHQYGYLAVGGFESGNTFIDRLSMYAGISAKCEISAVPSAQEITNMRNKLSNCDVIIVGYHATSTSPSKQYGVSKQVFDLLKTMLPNREIVLAYFGSPYFLSYAEPVDLYASSVIVAHDNSSEAQDRTAQMIFGGIPFSGKMPVSAQNFHEGYGLETFNSIRLKYVIPEETGISQKSLNSIDSLVLAGIRLKAFPGCQVIAAHRGEVFYYKAFGNHTYDKASPKVKISDVYDVASVTKVAATLPIVMRMVDEKLVDINSSLKQYVPMHPHSNKGDLKIKDILLHQSGLPSWVPFHYKYFVTPDGKPAISNRKTAEFNIPIPGAGRYLKNGYTLDRNFFSPEKTEKFTRPVANNLYGSNELREDIYAVIDTCTLMNTNYRYSDLGFIYMQRLIESVYDMTEDKLSQSLFYEPIGMNRTGYLPLERIPAGDIPPTEDDRLFRNQLLQGYVHDQAASLSGGVSGHAGLFSNANDLVKLYQMYLNGGFYGGTRYMTEETIAQFTSCTNCRQGNRRGLGFDKKDPDARKKSPICDEASLQSYGHTGFTGTMVWIDPERELVFIFLSNRINPSASNNKLSQLSTRSEIFARLIRAIDGKNRHFIDNQLVNNIKR